MRPAPHQLQQGGRNRAGLARGDCPVLPLAVDDAQGRSHVRPVGQATMHGLSGLTCMPSKVAAHSRLRNTRGWFRSQPHFHCLRVRLSPPWRLERHPRAGLTLCSVRGVNSKPIYHVPGKNDLDSDIATELEALVAKIKAKRALT